MRLKPGSPLWLLRHEIRLSWRNVSEHVGRRIAIPLVAWAALHAVAFFVMRNASVEVLLGPVVIIPGLIVWVVLTLMLSTAVILAVNALYDRGDLDLLISSPLPAPTIFAVRGVGVAVGAVAMIAAFLLPFVHMGVIHGEWRLIAVYPVLAAMALGITAIGFLLTLMLVRWLGARRARVVTQILSALIGASIFLGFQAFNFLPEQDPEVPFSVLTAPSSPWLAPSSPLWWPVRALLGDPLPTLATIALGTALFVVVIRSTSRIFVTGTQQSMTSRARPLAKAKSAKFQRGLARNILRKELRLIARDPNLIANTLLQGLFLVPILFLMLRNGEILLTMAPAALLLFSNLAGNLAWITISGEEAPDLIGSAPVSRDGVRWLKAAAALLPVAVLAVPFVIFYLLRAPLLAPVFVLFALLAVTASAVIQVWGGKPSGSRDLRLRQKQNIGLNFLEVFGAMAIAGSCYLAMIGSWWALAPLAVGFVAPVVAWTRRQSDAI